MRIGLKRLKNRIKTVFIVLMVSTSDCGSASMGSNPINHPNGELPERLKEQFAKLSSSNRCIGSNPILSAK